MTTHTPGPWRWIRDGNTWMLAHSGGGGMPIVLAAITTSPDSDEPGTEYLAVRENCPNGLPRRLVPLTPDHPDAKLIQAAPEMLSLLDDVAILLYGLGVGRKTREAVEALLARVKGEAAP